MEAKTGARRCGNARTQDSIYLEVGMGAGGIPIENYFVDLPVEIDPSSINLTPVGVQLIQSQTSGVWHVFDWIGEKHYPSPADFLEEARVMGISRKISPALDFSKLSADSRLICIHPHAVIQNPEELMLSSDYTWECPTGKQHTETQGCIGWHWCESLTPADATDGLGLLWRDQPSGSYQIKRSGGVAVTGVGIFANFPIHGLAVTAREDLTHDKKKLERVGLASGLLVRSVQG